MAEIIDVQIGQVKAVSLRPARQGPSAKLGTGRGRGVESSRGPVILRSIAIGSCVAIVAYDSPNKTAAAAHIMLPGRAPAQKSGSEKTKYAYDAIDAMVDKMAELGSIAGNVKVALLGGANVLQRDDDTICEANIESTLSYLKTKHIEVTAAAIGGTHRRNVWLEVDSGVVSYTEGDSSKRQLCRW